jgi:uncharacterized protein
MPIDPKAVDPKAVDPKAIDSKAIDSKAVDAQPPCAQQKNPERIQHLDIIRGIALLGILLMNIQSFAMPSSAYANPSSWGEFSGINYWYWMFNHIFADGKFINIFSMLFGAGICLFAENADRKGLNGLKLHYRRNIWLLLFGLVHAYFIWHGDILYSYALCSFWVVLLRNASQKTLWIIAMVLLIAGSGVNALLAIAVSTFPPDLYQELLQFWQPSAIQHELEIAAYTGSFNQQMQQRSMEALSMQTEVFFSYFIFRGTALMLIGMALFKSGFFSGLSCDDSSLRCGNQLSRKSVTQFYTSVAIAGIGVGTLLTGLGAYYTNQSNFDFNYAISAGTEWNSWGSLASAIGYIALIVLAIEKRWLQSLLPRFAAVGQMAFSHYIAQSLIGTFIFYGWGLSLFTQVERAAQFLIVAAIWGFQLWISPMWLRRCHFGPLEWLWRCLTYCKWQPFIKKS